MIELGVLLVLLFFSLLFYFFVSSYRFQIYLRKNKEKKKIVDPLLANVEGGTYQKYGYFSNNHKILTQKQLLEHSINFKSNFLYCYNIVKFTSIEGDFEVFFYLASEGPFFREFFCVRLFPSRQKIKSEATVEYSNGNLSILSNNRYLSEILEDQDTKTMLRWILKKKGDTLNLSQSLLFYKTEIKKPKDLNFDNLCSIIKKMEIVSKKIYKSGIIEF